jgi:hypothetical protein
LPGSTSSAAREPIPHQRAATESRTVRICMLRSCVGTRLAHFGRADEQRQGKRRRRKQNLAGLGAGAASEASEPRAAC